MRCKSIHDRLRDRAGLTALFVALLFCGTASAQSLHYFEFKTLCYTDSTNTWEDSSFIAATAQQDVIDSVYADLARPDSVRMMIAGPVDTGNAGYNHNASHWFLWHFIENQWQLQHVAIELCDACPTGVDGCTQCFIDIGSYCPWSSRVSREIFAAGIVDRSLSCALHLFPDPATSELNIELPADFVSVAQRVEILDLFGRPALQVLYTSAAALDVGQLPSGAYLLRLFGARSMPVATGRFAKQ